MLKYCVISFLILANLLIFGCDEQNEGRKTMFICGDMEVANETETMLDVSIIINSQRVDFGIVASKTSASMGFGKFEIGKKLKVKWIENFSSATPVKCEVIFDTMKLKDFAKQIKSVKFVYIGNKKWKLKVYKKPHRYAKDLIIEIDSE